MPAFNSTSTEPLVPVAVGAIVIGLALPWIGRGYDLVGAGAVFFGLAFFCHGIWVMTRRQ